MGFFDELKKSIFGEQPQRQQRRRRTSSANSKDKPPILSQIKKGPYKIILMNDGGKKIDCIKAVRGIRSELGLKEAKEIVESVPVIFLEGVSRNEAKRVKQQLESAGASVSIEKLEPSESEQPKKTRHKKKKAPAPAKPKKKTYQPPSTDKTIVIEYLNYAGELKQFIGDPKSIIRKGNHFSVRVAPTFTRISLDRSKTRILKGVPAPAELPTEPLPVQTTTSETSVVQYTNFEGIKKEFTIITGVIDDKGDYVRVRVSPTFKYITLKRTRIGNPEALFESTSAAPTSTEETAQVDPEPTGTEEPASQAQTGRLNIVLMGCGLATYDTTKILRDLQPNLSAFEMHGILRDFPKTVAENVPSEKAQEYKKRFEDAGCTVELHPGSGPTEQPELIEATEPQPAVNVEEQEPVAVEEPEPEPVAVKSTTMDVVITDCGISTSDATKVLKELRPDMGTFDLYGMLRNFPKTVAENVPTEKAEEYKKRFEDAGCTVELK